MTAFRLPEGGGGRPRQDARLHLRRQALSRLRGRQHRLGAARQWRSRGRPQLQVSPAARNLGRVDRGAERDRRRDALRPDDAEPARDHRSARERPRGAFGQCAADRGGRSRRADRQVLGLHAVGLLLQDVSLAALGDVRAGDPRACRPRPRRSGQSPVRRQSADQCALRRARRRRRPGRPRRGEGGGAVRSRRVPHRRPRRHRRAARPSRRRRSKGATGAAGPEASAPRSRRTADG